MNYEITPILPNALTFAFDRATTEGKIAIGLLAIVFLFSWTVIIIKAHQLIRARRGTKQFFKAFRASTDPFQIYRKGDEFTGAPAYKVYYRGTDELAYHLMNNPVTFENGARVPSAPFVALSGANLDLFARRVETKISRAAFDWVRAALRSSVNAEALSIERGMTALGIAAAAAPLIGLLGTAWGVLETFSGLATANSANLTAMASGLAGALIATVAGLLVAIPARFAHNLMATNGRAITQELDNFATELTTRFGQTCVDNWAPADERRAGLQVKQKSPACVEELEGMAFGCSAAIVGSQSTPWSLPVPN